MAGDFNLRGLASGGGLCASPESQHARMSTWFAAVLQLAGLHVVTSPATHSLGGTLVIHITGVDGSLSATLLPPMAKCPSDHRVAVVETKMEVLSSVVQGQPPRIQDSRPSRAWPASRGACRACSSRLNVHRLS